MIKAWIKDDYYLISKIKNVTKNEAKHIATLINKKYDLEQRW
jgi:hypothetical protein